MWCCGSYCHWIPDILSSPGFRDDERGGSGRWDFGMMAKGKQVEINSELWRNFCTGIELWGNLSSKG